MSRFVRIVTKLKWRIVSTFYCIVRVAEERIGLERVMNEVVEGWQEMEGNEKVVWVVGKACENGGVRRAIERMWRRWLT